MNSLIDLSSADLNTLLHEASGNRCCLHINKLHRDQMVGGQGVALHDVNALLCSVFVLPMLFLRWLADWSFLLCNICTFCFQNTSLNNHVK